MITWEKGCLRKFTHRKLLTFVVWTINSVIDKKDDYARDAPIELRGVDLSGCAVGGLSKNEGLKIPVLKEQDHTRVPSAVECENY